MKKIIALSVIIILLSPSLMAQQPSKELLEEAAKKFEGVWTGTDGLDTVTIYLVQTISPMEQLRPTDSIAPLYGWHEITCKGKIIESSAGFVNGTYNSKVTVYSGYKKATATASMVIVDITRGRHLGATLELTCETCETAVLKTWQLESFASNIPGQTFPKEIILKRISKIVIPMMAYNK